MPPVRFFALLGLGVLAACAAYAALVLHSATWAEARQLDALFPFYAWRTRSYPPAELARAWHLLAAGAATGAGLLAAPAAGRQQVRAWWRELGQAGAGSRELLRQLSPAQRRWAAGTLAALTALRLWLSQPSVTPAYDDVASYELFASKSLLAVAGYYPVPNNHVLANTLSWLFYHVQPGFWFTMRLPVLLVATAATGLLFGGLLWARAGFRVAWLATVLFSLTSLGLYHAAVGRGYWLFTALAGVVFFCTLAVSTAPRQARLAWSGVVLGSVAGLYTVPTFVFVVAPALSWLALGALRQRRLRLLAVVAGVGGLAAAGSVLLYAPLLFVSGPGSLLGNGFISAQTLPEFWAGLAGYLWRTEGALVGQMAVGGLLVLGGLGATLLLWPRATAPGSTVGAAWRRLVPASLWFMLVPYGVLAVKHVFAPERTLFYKGFFFFVLLALALDWLLRGQRRQARTWLLALLGGTAGLWGGYQLRSLWRDSRPLLLRNQDFHAAFQWLDGQPPGAMLVPEPTHSLFLRMYLHAERPGQHWQLDAFPRPGVAYRYVLAFPDRRGYFQPRFAGPPVFQNAQVVIYQPIAQPSEAGLPDYWYLAK